MKLKNQFTINLDDGTAQAVEKLAKYYNRKPAELLRLLLLPSISDQWAKVQTIEHPENQAAFIRL